jgi:hypothetical protein
MVLSDHQHVLDISAVSKQTKAVTFIFNSYDSKKEMWKISPAESRTHDHSISVQQLNPKLQNH